MSNNDKNIGLKILVHLWKKGLQTAKMDPILFQTHNRSSKE